MCGIAGFFGMECLPRDIHKASDLIAHRGPDGNGIARHSFVGKNDAPMLVEFAHRRLSIVDLSERGRQPFKDNKGRLLVFNGEIFNWRILRSELEAEGYKFISNTDTEVVLAGYDFWKYKVFERLNGFWAIGIYDPHDSDGPSLVLSRDRCGIKPLYYMVAEKGGQKGIYFSSEIRSLMALAEQSAEVVPHRVVEFSVKGFLSMDGETIYKHIKEFPIASYSVFKPSFGEINFDKYWELPFYANKVDNEEHALDVFSEILENTVDDWMQAAVPVVLTLSSGIDSSVIAVAAARKGYSDITAFSSHFPGSPLDEFELAGELAGKLGMRHVPVTPQVDDLGADVATFSRHQETMFTSFSQFVSWRVLREICANGYKAYLSGQGGDELFLGYQRYLSSYIRNNIDYEESLIERIIGVHRNTNLSWAKIFAYSIYFNGNQFRTMRGTARAKRIFNPQYIASGLAGSMQDTPSDLKKLQLSETLGVSQLRRLLRFDDRSSSAFGIEGRPVLLDHRLVEFAFSLSPRLLIKNGWTKYILRKYLDRHGHSNIAWRKNKLGFPAPDTYWSEQWLKSNWCSAKKQKTLENIILPDLKVEKLGSWEKLALSIVSLTASEMRWQ